MASFKYLILTLFIAMFISKINFSLAARHLLQSYQLVIPTLSIIPTLPKLTLPPLLPFPKLALPPLPTLPPLPKLALPSLPPFPMVPKSALQPLPLLPPSLLVLTKSTLPPLPWLTTLPKSTLPPLPPLPTLPKPMAYVWNESSSKSAIVAIDYFNTLCIILYDSIKSTFGVKLKTLSTSGLGQILLLPATASAIYPTGDGLKSIKIDYPSISGIWRSIKQASKLWGGLSIAKAALPLSTQVTIAPYFDRAPSATLLLTTLSSTTKIRFCLSKIPSVDGFFLLTCPFLPLAKASWRQAIKTPNRRGLISTLSAKPADLISKRSLGLMELRTILKMSSAHQMKKLSDAPKSKQSKIYLVLQALDR
ncbi:hypothetical protein CFP56_025588 [Quercus suber]|uniref:Uncharacterized protein n=1 Tax=Quercus suber TaxID=58331 RepID=A0AAW0K2N6_QUESU